MELKDSLKGLSTDKAIEILDKYIAEHPDDDEALTLRGMRHWGAGHRSQAMTDYLSALRINPSSRAAMALKAAQEILDYRNKDLYNP